MFASKYINIFAWVVVIVCTRECIGHGEENGGEANPRGNLGRDGGKKKHDERKANGEEKNQNLS